MYNFTKSIFLLSFFCFVFTFTAISQTTDVIVTTYEDINGNGLNGGEPPIIVTPELWDMGTGMQSAIPYLGGMFMDVPIGNYELRLPLNSGVLHEINSFYRYYCLYARWYIDEYIL
jgi:hypothetical protein